jgi:hybrid cluster-associated redox disulfide protein
MTDSRITITKDMIMSDILQKIPEATEMIQKYFQGACFGCPSLQLETLEMAAQMHGHDVNKLIDELENIANTK